MILGVGSVTDSGTASLYMQIGAQFIVTPALREDVILTCNRRKILCAPGCATLSEICKAEELGCDIVKLFPGSVYGPNFIKSVKAPQPWTKIMPTGGVTLEHENLNAWFKAGASCVGMGSKLLSKGLIAAGDYATIESRVKETLENISTMRQA